jgi:hypothetical protein
MTYGDNDESPTKEDPHVCHDRTERETVDDLSPASTVHLIRTDDPQGTEGY